MKENTSENLAEFDPISIRKFYIHFWVMTLEAFQTYQLQSL